MGDDRPSFLKLLTSGESEPDREAGLCEGQRGSGEAQGSAGHRAKCTAEPATATGRPLSPTLCDRQGADLDGKCDRIRALLAQEIAEVRADMTKQEAAELELECAERSYDAALQYARECELKTLRAWNTASQARARLNFAREGELKHRMERGSRRQSALRAAVAAERERLLKALASAHDADVITHKQYSYIRAELVGDQPPMSGREPAAIRAAVAAERERACGLMRELMEREKKPSERRMAYAIAENTIRRGRTLTATEQLENLAKAFEEWGDPKTAAAIRGDQP